MSPLAPAPGLFLNLHSVLKREGLGVRRQLDAEFDLSTDCPGLELVARRGGEVLARLPVAGTPGRRREILWLAAAEDHSVVEVELASAGAALARTRVTLAPCRPWSIHLLHHSHFDYGYTTLQPDVLRLQLANLDAVLDHFEETRGETGDEQFRWNVECTYPLLKYLAARPHSDCQRLLRASREGRLEVAAMLFTMQSEGCSVQELVRSLAPVRHLREMGFAVQTAVQSDVPGIAPVLPRLLNSLGIRHLAMAPNNFRAPFSEQARRKVPRPFLWQGPRGGELLTWCTDLYDHVYQEGNILGFLDGVEAVQGAIGARLSGLEADGFPWTTLGLRIQGSYSDNGRPAPQIARIAGDWNVRYAAPQVRMSTFHQFFDALERETAGRVTAVRAFWPDWWNEGIGSMSREFALHRRSQEKAVFADTGMALAACGGARSKPYGALADELWEKILLCDEHTWGAAVPEANEEAGPRAGELQAGFKKSFFFQAALTAEQAENSARAFWAATSPRGPAPAILVQNALSWPRSGLVELDSEELKGLLPGTENWQFVDAVSERTLASQQSTRGGAATVRVYVEEVAGFGQRVVSVQAATKDGSAWEVPLSRRDIHRGRLCNARSTVETCPRTGGLLQWTLRETGQRWLDESSPFLFGGVVHQKLARRHSFFPHQEITVTHTEDHASLDEVVEGPLFSRLLLHSRCGPTRVRREVVLHHATARVDVITTLQKPVSPEPEAVFMALPLNVAGGRCIVGTNGGPMVLGESQLPGSSSDWFVLRDHLDVAGPEDGVMVALPDTPLVQLGDIRQPSLRGTGRDAKELFVYVLNNLWPTNFAASQGGEFTFRASLMDYSHPYDPAWSRRRALECVSPLRAFLRGSAAGGSAAAADPVPSLRITASDNVIASLAPADGGVAMLVEEIGGQRGSLGCDFSHSDVRRFCRTTAAGEVNEEIPIQHRSVNLHLQPDEIAFFHCELNHA